MSCDRFDKYDRGKIDKEDFHAHLSTCAECRESVREDEKLLSRAKELKKPQESPFLWTRIEQNLLGEMQKKRTGVRAVFIQTKWKFYPAAALLMFLLSSGLVFLLRPGLKGQDLLSDSSLRRIEKRERRYESSIQRLEENARPQMAELDLELMLLYRDRLEIIDQQIVECKEALSSNSGNAHIRRYMLAAFQEKKNTLRDIMRASELMNQEKILE